MRSPPQNPIVIIPARMGSARLPGKPLALIADDPMIVHCWRKALQADIGPVVVACAEKEIAEVIENGGGTSVLTNADLPSGSDRVAEAIDKLDPNKEYDAIINLQGDLPTLDPECIKRAFKVLENPEVDIATLVSPITNDEERFNPNVVKAVLSIKKNPNQGRALYFSRSVVPSGDGYHYHHIGIYAYRREILEEFIDLPISGLEERERLEQLRALESGMRIDAALVDTVPVGVDTPSDLEYARAIVNKLNLKNTT